MTLYRRQGARPFPRKRNAKKQNGRLRRYFDLPTTLGSRDYHLILSIDYPGAQRGCIAYPRYRLGSLTRALDLS